MFRLRLVSIAMTSGLALSAQTYGTGAFTGKVVSKLDGSPCVNAQVTITKGDVHRTVSTGSDGKFRLGLLSPGMWHLKVSKDGYLPTSELSGANSAKGISIEAGKTVELEVQLQSASCADPYYRYPPWYIDPIDFNQPGTSLKLNSETWSHLPLR